MEGSFLSPPAKRSISYTATGMPDPNPKTVNGSSKRSKQPPPSVAVPPGHVSFRLLCHASRIGGIIGKSGSVIKHLQQATSSKIRVEDAPADSPDRVVVVVASSAIKSARLPLTVTSDANGGVNCVEAEVSPAQEALIRVFERILDVAAEADGLGVAPGSMVSIRLLAEASQVGSVIGKGGKVVEKIRKESGCKIRVLAAEKMPCAGPTDEVVEIEGDILAVKKALIAISRRLQDCSPLDKTKTTRSRPHEAVPHETLPDMQVDLLQRTVLPPLSSSSMSYTSGGRHPLSVEEDRVPTFDVKTNQDEVKFRILCSNDRVGGVIGKGGTIIKALQSETGASITVGNSVSDCDERLITITALENTESRYSPAQNAIVLVFSRSVEAGIEKGLDSGSNKGSPVATRLLVPSNQIGCLLGKGGAIISEMRRSTGANIRIIGPDQIPKCASEKDQVVQISGEFVNVQDALYHITSRLRENLFPSKTLNDAGPRSSSSGLSEISPYSRTSKTLNDAGPRSSSSGLSEISPYSRTKDSTSVGGHQSISISHSLNRNTNLTHSMDHLGLSHSLVRPTSPQLWSSQTIAGVNSRGTTTDIGRGLTSLKGGLELGSGSRNRSVMVTNTTVEIVIPESVVGAVYGENGSNLARLRQISGAKVIMHEPQSGTRERIVVISGTPDEAQAAQSLLHAFILTGSL